MRGFPDHSKEQPQPSPTPTPTDITVGPGTLVEKEPLGEDLAALGREVLDMVPRKQRGASLDVYRQAALGLSRVLKVTGVRVTPRVLFYLALRVKWLADNTAA